MVKSLPLLLTLALLGGCTVGPDYVRPETALPEHFDQAQNPTNSVAAAGPLWSSFEQPELARLLARAVEANQDLAQAAARLAETRALSGLSVYSLFPTVTALGEAERSQTSAADPFAQPGQGRSDSYRAGFDAQWEIDLFGSLRNQSNAIYQRVDADAARLAAVRVSLLAETAQAWFALRGAQQQRALQRAQLDNLQHNVELLQTLLDAGRGNALDLSRAQTEARTLAAELPDREAEVVRQEQRLAVLTAWPLAELRRQLAAEMTLPSLPALTVLGTPREWLLRRPDILAAERDLAAANSDIGYETAQYFPILTLFGDFGWTAQSFGRLGGQGSERWRFGPSLSWRFLDFGRVRQDVRAAESRAEAAQARYRQSVLLALEETENSLAELRAANQSLAALQQAVQAADETLRLARMRFEAGASSYLEVIDAQRGQLQLQSRQLQAQLRQLTAMAALYKALAGDFVQRPQTAQADPD